MKKIILYIFFLILSIACTIGIWTYNPRKAQSSTIIGNIIDLANQPIPEIPLILYNQENKNEHIYATITDTTGKFKIPDITKGIYYFHTILNKEKITLQPFHILPDTELVELRLIYSDIIQHEIQPTEIEQIPVKPIEPEEPIQQEPIEQDNTQLVYHTNGKLEGEILVDGKPLYQMNSITLQQTYLETNQVNEINVPLLGGQFQISNLPPGQYSYVASIAGHNPSKPTEVFILSNATSTVKIYLTSKSQESKKTANLSVTVIDSSWTPQIGAEVTIVSSDGQYSQTSQTDDNGETILKGIPSGDYRVQAGFSGINGYCQLEEYVTLQEGKFSSIVLREYE
ncbi:MAG TPA: carboxypeptidase-like regulatory domain-containing protein [Planctomycetota bacterium]|nr:carboxypeptidase-like regulatory domain-containing protein [Planctomycetota bacterium]